MELFQTKRICLWSGPRNISTALMYSFAQRSDTVVYDEPLYGYYLANSPAKDYHPGAEEVLASMETDGDNVVKMMMGNHPKQVVFFKNMGHHLLQLDRTFMKDTCNVILTRDPREVIPSFAKEIENPTMIDVGFKAQVELLNDLKKMNAEVFVLDSSTILKNPEIGLSNLCEKLKIPFDRGMLNWEAGARAEDGVWAKYWYKNVHTSKGFQPFLEKNQFVEDRLRALLEACMPYYEILKLQAESELDSSTL